MAKPAKAKVMPLTQIKMRPNKSLETRELNIRHVLDLAQSIATVDLIEPLVVDLKGCLIAGGHRLAACHILTIADKDLDTLIGGSFNFQDDGTKGKMTLKSALKKARQIRESIKNPPETVPVRVLPIDSKKNPKDALIAETVENEKRKDYSKEEIMNLADKLATIPEISTDPGAPEKGKKKLNPVLQAITGKSQRTIQRILKDKKDGKTTTNGVVSVNQKPDKHLKLKNSIEKYLSGSRDKELNDLLRKTIEILLSKTNSKQS